MELPLEVQRIMAEMIHDLTPKHRRFPGGFRYRYYHAAKRKRHRDWRCAWSTVRNENGKFVSFVYELQGNRWTITREREHRKRTAAKARALRLSRQRTAAVRKVPA